MAQLSDDCFAHGGQLMPLDEALALLENRISPVTGVESATLEAALGRVLAEDVVAPRSVPPHDNSAVDGYAVFFDDLAGARETELPVAGRAAAGHPWLGAARRGTAIRIFTGAPMPIGERGEAPDTVFMQEDCVPLDGGTRVRVLPGIQRGANRRKRGEDIEQGATILRQGRRLRPQDIGLAASIGRTSLRVRTPLRVALCSSGDEIREPGTDAPPGTVYDANRFTVRALLCGLGCTVTDLGILPDDANAIRSRLADAARTHDLVVASGGVSGGEEDHVRGAIEALGRLYFWRLAIKPGRPIALGQIGRTPVVGLPGNPVAVMVTFLRIARPLILRLAGAEQIQVPLYRVKAGFDYRKKADRREWIRSRLSFGHGGDLVAQIFPRQGAGILSSIVESDGLVELPEGLKELRAGDTVAFLPFSAVGA
jgi:molybdopterin molybdotransferase